ncbi:MAG: hypothetical protein ACREJC_21595, partial [Tepidisphaeraceae bacterium]
MNSRRLILYTPAIVLCMAARTLAASAFSNAAFTLQQTPETIYAPPAPPKPDEGVNQGAVHLDLVVRYMTDFIYRGVDYSEVGGGEDSPNLQFQGKLSFDLGKLPHPYMGLFVNVYDSDPVSNFQAVWPVVGFDWPIKPITVSGGGIWYIYPDRDEQNTAEFFGKVTLNDAGLFRTEKPIFSPYVYGAYDYDLYNGWYFEAGVEHDFEFRDLGVTLKVLADVAFVSTNQFFATTPGGNDTGFQHY